MLPPILLYRERATSRQWHFPVDIGTDEFGRPVRAARIPAMLDIYDFVQAVFSKARQFLVHGCPAWIVSSVLNAGQIDLDGCSAFDRGIEQAARDDALECLLRQSDQSGLCVQYHRLAGKITDSALPVTGRPQHDRSRPSKLPTHQDNRVTCQTLFSRVAFGWLEIPAHSPR